MSSSIYDFKVGTERQCLGRDSDVCAAVLVLAFKEVELDITRCDAASHKVQRRLDTPHLVRNLGSLSNGLRCQAVRRYDSRRGDAFADAFLRVEYRSS